MFFQIYISHNYIYFRNLNQQLFVRNVIISDFYCEISLHFIMKEEELGFKGRIGAFKLTRMELLGKGDSQLLEIELEHPEKMEIYDIVADMSTLKSHPVFGGLYDTLE